MIDNQTYRAYQVMQSNAELPVTLDMTRAHLRLGDDRNDEEYVIGLIRSCAAAIERQYGLALLTQTVAQYHQGFPTATDSPLLLRIAPLASITTIQYVDSAGVTQTWSNTEYGSGHYNQTGFVVPKIGKTWPTDVANLPNSVTVTYQAGFGSKASDIPADIRSALLLMIGRHYDNREDAPSTLPTASTNLLMPYYRFSV